jgi:hypothetical protein
VTKHFILTSKIATPFTMKAIHKPRIKTIPLCVVRSAAFFITSLSFAIDGPDHPDYPGHPGPRGAPPKSVEAPSAFFTAANWAGDESGRFYRSIPFLDLSAHAYLRDPNNLKSLNAIGVRVPTGYKLIDRPFLNHTGIRASAFRHEVSGDIVIAFGGTKLEGMKELLVINETLVDAALYESKSIPPDKLDEILRDAPGILIDAVDGVDDIVNDAEIGLNQIPPQFRYAEAFAKKIISSHASGGERVYTTGHSLGGALATYVALRLGVDGSLTFASPPLNMKLMEQIPGGHAFTPSAYPKYVNIVTNDIVDWLVENEIPIKSALFTVGTAFVGRVVRKATGAIVRSQDWDFLRPDISVLESGFVETVGIRRTGGLIMGHLITAYRASLLQIATVPQQVELDYGEQSEARPQPMQPQTEITDESTSGVGGIDSGEDESKPNGPSSQVIKAPIGGSYFLGKVVGVRRDFPEPTTTLSLDGAGDKNRFKARLSKKVVDELPLNLKSLFEGKTIGIRAVPEQAGKEIVLKVENLSQIFREDGQPFVP